jgi:hypothetical protein
VPQSISTTVGGYSHGEPCAAPDHPTPKVGRKSLPLGVQATVPPRSTSVKGAALIFGQSNSLRYNAFRTTPMGSAAETLVRQTANGRARAPFPSGEVEFARLNSVSRPLRRATVSA